MKERKGMVENYMVYREAGSYGKKEKKEKEEM